VLGDKQSFGDPQTQSGSRPERSAGSTTVEALEEVRKVGQRDTRPVVPDLDDQLVVNLPHHHVDRGTSRGGLRRSLEQVGQGGRGQSHVQPHGRLKVRRQVHLVFVKHVFHETASGDDDFRGISPLTFHGCRAGVNAAISKMFCSSQFSRATSARMRSDCSCRSSALNHGSLRLLAAPAMTVSRVRRSCPSDAKSTVSRPSVERAGVLRGERMSVGVQSVLGIAATVMLCIGAFTPV
jgi:hypothetical protein